MSRHPVPVRLASLALAGSDRASSSAFRPSSGPLVARPKMQPAAKLSPGASATRLSSRTTPLMKGSASPVVLKPRQQLAPSPPLLPSASGIPASSRSTATCAATGTASAARPQRDRRRAALRRLRRGRRDRAATDLGGGAVRTPRPCGSRPLRRRSRTGRAAKHGADDARNVAHARRHDRADAAIKGKGKKKA